ncbi:MAG TPA: AsmA family protein [Gallionella sp.]|nr:AsmA family protein [Gallionella sp.]
MNKILKYGLLGTGAVVGIAAAGIVYVVVTFNPNDYKPQIIQAVKESKQRTLRLDGDIKLSFFPNIGANLSNVSLSEFMSAKEFAAIESARVSLAFMPLLRKQVEVNEVAVSGLNATLVKHKDGTTNIDDLLGKNEKKQEESKKEEGPPVKLDIARVSISNTSLTYRDEETGAQYTIKNLNLKTGRIAVGVPSKIDLSVDVQANQPKLDISTQLKTTLTFDLDKQKYHLEGLDLQASGAVLDISNLKAKASGDASADLATQEYSTQKFSLNATGVKAKDNFDVALNAPALSLTKDKLSGSKLALNAKLDGATGNIAAILSVPSLEGSLKSIKASALNLDLKAKLPQPKLDVAAQLKTALTLDPEKQSLQLKGLDLQASGSALDMSDLKLKASGDASANLTAKEFGAQKFSLQASGMKAKDSFEAVLDAPQLGLIRNKFSGDKLTLKAKLDGALGNVVASVSLPGVEGNEQSFKISALAMDLDVKQPEQAFKVKLSSPVSGSIQAQQINLSNLVIAIKATGDKLPNKSVNSEMKGSVQVDAIKESVQANLAGGLLQSNVKAKVDVKGFAKPAINFDVDVDQFDADLYLPKTPGAAAPKSKEPEQPLDLSALRTLNLDGSLRIGSFKVVNVKTSQVRMDVKAHNGQLNVNPLSVNLYQGSANLIASVNAAPAAPNFAVNGNLTGINIAPLLKDAVDLDIVEGKGNVTLNLTTQGNLVSALKKSLNGTMAVNLADGAIRGINLPKLVQGVQSLGKSSSMQTMGVNKDEKTGFSEFKASFKVNNGVAHNEDLAVKAPILRITGNGDIDIGNDSLNYTTKVTVSKTEGGGSATLPVYLSGPYTALKYKVDFGSMVADVAKQKLEAKKEEIKEKAKEDAKAKVQEELKKGLKSLFK